MLFYKLDTCGLPLHTVWPIAPIRRTSDACSEILLIGFFDMSARFLLEFMRSGKPGYVYFIALST